MGVRFHASAFRHRVSRDLMLDVIATATPVYNSAPEDPDEEDLALSLGLDRNGIPLEVVAIELDDGGLVVIQAMPMRRKYEDLYRELHG